MDELMPYKRPGVFSASRWKWYALGLLSIGLLMAREPVIATLRNTETGLSAIPTATVERTDLAGEVLVAGRVASTESTQIRCMLERLTSAGGAVAQSGGSSTILSLVPDGADVQKGDILCEMDASAYSDLVSNQEIAVEQARSNRLQAALALDVAKLSLQAYRQGEQVQVESSYMGQVALAKSDLSRQADRVAWAERMVEKGYVSLAQLSSERLTLDKLKVSLRRSELALEIYRKFTAPKELLSLQSQIIGAQATLGFQDIRLNREVERLNLYRAQLEHCTIRAPHAGYVVYANRPGREPAVYEGAPVRERMPLFTLPDQSKLEVELLLHETTIDHVREGMPASICIEAFPESKLMGIVSSVSPVPVSDRSRQSSGEVTYFIGHVQFGSLPAKVRPGMTTQVTIFTGLREKVLAVPTMAVTVEDQHDVCYVDHHDSVERRAVKVSHASRDMMEVLDGLSEGERVFLSPSLVASRAR
ncbi:MAG: efflux RND transporter periplasmic adaptor subunit [Isosphaeraceae bacterium]